MKSFGWVIICLMLVSCDDTVNMDVTKVDRSLIDGVNFENLKEADVIAKISNFDLDRICTGVLFELSDGSEVEGKKNCEVEGLKECDEDGEIECKSNSSFPVVSIDVLRSENIKKDITIGGVVGEYPSASYPLEGNTSVVDLSLTNFNSRVSSSDTFEFFDSLGQKYSLTGDSGLIASNIKNGVEIFGISGTDTGSYSDCTSNGQIGCLTDSTYKAADFSNITAGNIKKGVVIGGVTGDYPSSSHLLEGATSTMDLMSTNFNSALTSSSAFEYFDSVGRRYTGVGDEDLASANIITGKEIFGVSGSDLGEPCRYSTEASCKADNACSWNGTSCSLNPWVFKSGHIISGISGKVKTNCRNLISTSGYNTDNMPPGNFGDTSGSNRDWWDTAGFLDGVNFANTKPSSWSNDNVCGEENWSDITADGACNSSVDDCVMKDNITGLSWSETGPSSNSSPNDNYVDWSSAIQSCYNLNFAGHTDWRMPTAFELQHALANGFGAIAYHDSFPARPAGNTLIRNEYFMPDKYATFWSATTWLGNTDQAYIINIAGGYQAARLKSATDEGKIVCVR